MICLEVGVSDLLVQSGFELLVAKERKRSVGSRT